MDRRQNLLKAKDLPNLPSGWHSDGGGLYLVVSDKGHRAWIHRATVSGTKKRQEDKLGNFPDMPLNEARRKRDRRCDGAKAAHAASVTPQAPKLDRNKTVRVVAELWIENCTGTGRWKSLTYPDSVRQRLRDHVYPIIGHQPIATLNHDMICEVLDRPGADTDTRTFWVRPPIAPWPNWLLAQALPPPPPPVPPVAVVSDGKLLRGILTVVTRAAKGERNNSLHWAACRFAESTLDRSDATALLLDAAAQTGLSAAEARATIASAYRRQARRA